MAQDIMKQASAFVGVPYLLRGRTPVAWDCWGCTRFLRDELFGKPTPSWAETYSIEDGANGVRLADKVEELVRERLHAWTRVGPRPGAVVLLSFFDRTSHIGLMLTERDFIHALYGCQTVINSVDEPRWKGRVRGHFDA